MTILNHVTLVEGAIHNPNEPRHFMRIAPASRRQLATVGGQVVADSRDAVSEHPAAAWSYITMVAGDELCDLIAFDATQLRVSQDPEAER